MKKKLNIAKMIFALSCSCFLGYGKCMAATIFIPFAHCTSNDQTNQNNLSADISVDGEQLQQMVDKVQQESFTLAALYQVNPAKNQRLIPSYTILGQITLDPHNVVTGQAASMDIFSDEDSNQKKNIQLSIITNTDRNTVSLIPDRNTVSLIPFWLQIESPTIKAKLTCQFDVQ